MANQLPGGVFRSDLKLSDGRDIFYYDSSQITRDAKDNRDEKSQPGIGHLRLDPLLNEWVAVASHRQHRVFLPPVNLLVCSVIKRASVVAKVFELSTL